MSGAVDRVRAWLRRTAVGDIARVHGAPVVAVDTGDVSALMSAYDDALAEAISVQKHLGRVLVERDAAQEAHARLVRVLSDRKGALESVTPERVRAYLAEHGWTLRNAVTLGTGFPVEFWQHVRSPDVMLAVTMDAADYAECVGGVARRCGVVEGRDIAFVLAEWLSASGDARP